MIYWINNPFDALPLEGGRPMRYWLLARELVELGHEVVWWSSDFHHLEKKRRDLQDVYVHEGIQIRLIPSLHYKRNISLRRLRSHALYAKQWEVLAFTALNCGELKAPQAVVISMPPLGLYAHARSICAATGAKLFVDVQDAWPETFYQSCRWLPQPVKRALLSPLHRMAQAEYRGADFLTAVAGSYIELAQEYGCKCECALFPLGCEDSRSVSGDGLRKGSEFLELVYIGNLGESYDLRTLIAGVRWLCKTGVKVRLRVAGDGPLAGYVSQAAEQVGAALEYCGYLSESEMSALLETSDIGIVPMNPASLVFVPNKLIDYAVHGLAVVSSLQGESCAMLEQYACGGVYEFGNTASFVDAVRRYDGDRSLLAEHQRNARRLFEERFDAAKIYPEMARELAGYASG